MIELLAPAGSQEALVAAVQSGADAVYLGAGPLNARRNAKNFSRDELPGVVRYCHLRGTKVYLTLNTLLAQRELPLAVATARDASRAGVDAILVQDLGLARLLRAAVPDVPLHASTQMTVCSLDGVRACADLGMERVVLSRELPETEVRALCASSPVELEVFVHGALCMCYSGQCFFSAVLGGRSGNRGLCAQPCRLAFRAPGQKKPGHPLSLKDLCLAGDLAAMERMGLACLKLEGRMKRPEYVAVVTAIYAACLREGRGPTPQEQEELAAAFSREGFTQGYWRGRTGPAMFGARPEGTREPEALFAAARQRYGHGEHRLVPVALDLTVRAEEPLRLTVSDGDGHRVSADGAVPEAARSRAVTAAQLTAQLGKTGGTVYRAEDVRADVADGLSVPLSAVNALRRDALAALDAARTAPPPRRDLPLPEPAPRRPGWSGDPALSLSFHRADQLSAAVLDQGPAFVWLPVEELAAHRADVAAWAAAYPAVRFGAVLPRVVWDGELPQLDALLDAARAGGATEALLGHIGQLRLARAHGLTPRGDYGLGLMNDETAHVLADLGFRSVTASFEARFAQIRALDKPVDTTVLVYGRLPLMLTQNCLQKTADGRCLCRTGPQALRDRRGEALPIERAFGCRSELFNARVLWLADKRADWQGLGARYARLSFLRESAAECAAVVRAYRTGEGAVPEEFTRGLYYKGVE